MKRIVLSLLFMVGLAGGVQAAMGGLSCPQIAQYLCAHKDLSSAQYAPLRELLVAPYAATGPMPAPTVNFEVKSWFPVLLADPLCPVNLKNELTKWIVRKPNIIKRLRSHLWRNKAWYIIVGIALMVATSPRCDIREHVLVNYGVEAWEVLKAFVAGKNAYVGALAPLPAQQAQCEALAAKQCMETAKKGWLFGWWKETSPDAIATLQADCLKDQEVINTIALCKGKAIMESATLSTQASRWDKLLAAIFTNRF